MSAIQDLVEVFRVKLGLLPWAEHEHNSRNGRGFGRTTHMILRALAYLVLHPDETVKPDCRIIVTADPSAMADVRARLRQYAARLDIDETRVEWWTHQKADELLANRNDPRVRVDRRRIQFFVDHYDEEYEQALALVRRRDAIRKGET